jgi:hypothetical protein
MEVLAAAIEASAVGSFVRESAWAYPAANLLHLLGLVLLVGAIGIVDLRITGAFRNLPVHALSRTLTPLALLGLALIAVSGPLLFSADAVALTRSATFGWKLALIAVALLNALLFRLLWRDTTEEASVPLRLMALTSLALWLCVAALGRLIAYS